MILPGPRHRPVTAPRGGTEGDPLTRGPGRSIVSEEAPPTGVVIVVMGLIFLKRGMAAYVAM